MGNKVLNSILTNNSHTNIRNNPLIDELLKEIEAQIKMALYAKKDSYTIKYSASSISAQLKAEFVKAYYTNVGIVVKIERNILDNGNSSIVCFNLTPFTRK